MNSVGTVIAPGAGRELLANQPRLAAPYHPRLRHRRAAPRTAIKVAASQKLFSKRKRARTLVERGALEHSVKSAPSNKRLKLAGGDRFKGSGVFAPLTGRGLSSTALARGGLGPAA